jgi:MFS family permease
LNRTFYALVISQTTTNLGFSLYTMVVVMHLYNETGSTALSASVTLTSVIARMLSGICLPGISQRMKTSALLKMSQFIQLTILIGIYVLLFQELTTFILIFFFALLAIISFFNGFFSPLKSSIVRGIVPEPDRVKANSLIASIDQTFLFAGWTFGGLLLAFFGKHPTFLITFALLAISLFCLQLVKDNNKANIQMQESLVSSLTSGWKYLFQHKGLKVMVIMDLMEAWVGTIWIGAVTLVYAEDALGKGEAWWGYINGSYYLGTILGGFFVYRLSRLLKGRLTIFMLIGSALFGLLTFTYGFISNPYLALFLVILMGPSYQIRDLAQETMYQNSSDEKTLTKVLAARSTLIQIIFIISIIGIGVLTDLIGVRLIYILSGCLLMVSSVFGFFNLILKKQGIVLEEEASSPMNIHN